MQALKQFLQFYFIGIVLVFITTLLFGAGLLKIITSFGLYILPIVFCIVGYVVGLIMFELNLRKQDKKKKLFTFGYCFGILALLTVTIIISVNSLREINHKKQFENVEANHSVMKNWVNDNEEYIRIAFNCLEKEFKNPNDFNLDAFHIKKKDTSINGLADTVYNVYFVYYLNTDTTNKYFSKVSVFATKPELKIYNIDTKKNDEYIKIKAAGDEAEHEAIKDLNDFFKRLKDSLQKKN